VHPGIPAALDNVIVDAVIVSDSGTFVYNYTIQNKTSNDAHVYRFSIDVTQRIGDSVVSKLSESNSNCTSWYDDLSRLQNNSVLTTPVVVYSPEGVHKDQNGGNISNWYCGIDSNGRAYWAASFTERLEYGKRIGTSPAKNGYPGGKIYHVDKSVIEYFLTPPGRQQSGFRIVSKGLPGIRSFRAEQLLDIAESDISSNISNVDKLSEETGYTSYTVGPSALPASKERVTLLQYLLNVVDQAVSIAWISKDDPKLNEIYTKLHNLKEGIKDSESRNMIGALTELKSDVRSLACIDKEQKCSSNGKHEKDFYVVLYYNLEQILSAL
jgi:hypothetical protein